MDRGRGLGFSISCTHMPISAASTAARSPVGPAPLMSTRTWLGAVVRVRARVWVGVR